MKMSPSGKSAKRQRPSDVKVDTPSRPKRLKTDQQVQIVHKKDAATEASSKERDVVVKASSGWSLDLMFRGHIYDIDPIFSTDEKYLFLSRGDAIQVYSMSTHRPVKTLTTKDASHVTGLKLVPSDSQHIYVSTSSGKLIRWNWDTSKEITARSNFSKVISYEIIPVKVQNEEEERMAYFAVKETKHGKRCNIVTNLDWKNSPDIVVLQNTNYINHLRVLRGGLVVVACAREHIIIGTLRPSSREKGQYDDYVWREFRLPVKQITCLDVQEVFSATAGKDSNSDVDATINIAVGDTSGAILVYHDVLNSINRDGASSDASKSGLPLLHRLHWHREPVASLRWSKDGNYIISGGKESVIVFWQLDSGRRNFLPHLPSPIRSLTISSGGALYAVQLADKSITVISATELHSVATIEGLQLSSLVDTNDKAAVRSLQGKYPATLHPLQSERLLAAIPGGDSQSLSFLQTFNIQTGSHISRQALTRTNVTVLNKGPEGTPILPPNVELMELSKDGKWLATVDTWTPPQQDIEASSSPLLSENTERSEIFLKFWHWNETRDIWELATRVESPHLASSGEPVKIVSLEARPDRSEFVTFGADDTLRVWQPVARHGGSVRAQPRSDAVEHTWKSQHSLRLTGQAGYDAGQKLPGRVMSFSEDGSIIAVCMNSTIHLIDTRKWTVYYTRNAFTCEKIRSIEFLGRFLIILSEESLAIWNVVEDVLRTPVKPGVASQDDSSHKYISLAVDSSTETFAVVTRTGDRNSAYGMAVYTPSTMTTSFETVLEKPPLNVLADPSTGGYIVIDHAANIWRLGSGNTKSQALLAVLPADASGQQHAGATGFGDIFGRLDQKALEGQKSISSSQSASSALALQRGLGGIFDRAPPFALPPATTLFKEVINSLVPGA